MFVAWRDLRFAKGRFALMGTVIVLITRWSGLLSGLTAGPGPGEHLGHHRRCPPTTWCSRRPPTAGASPSPTPRLTERQCGPGRGCRACGTPNRWAS